MTTEFVEFAQITELMAQVRGESQGLVNGAVALQKHLAVLDALVTRALAQVETVTTRAAALSERARRDVTRLTADPTRDEFAALRETARAALR